MDQTLVLSFILFLQRLDQRKSLTLVQTILFGLEFFSLVQNSHRKKALLNGEQEIQFEDIISAQARYSHELTRARRKNKRVVLSITDDKVAFTPLKMLDKDKCMIQHVLTANFRLFGLFLRVKKDHISRHFDVRRTLEAIK